MFTQFNEVKLFLNNDILLDVKNTDEDVNISNISSYKIKIPIIDTIYKYSYNKFDLK